MARRPPKSIPEHADTEVDRGPVRRLPSQGRSEPSSSGLPRIEVPPHAARILGAHAVPSGVSGGPDHDTSPRVGGYALVARFPSSASADVFLGYKVTPFGFLRRAVVKWVDARRPDRAVVGRTLADEARAISCLDHPNVVSIYDYGEDDAGAHLAVEYVAGTDLRRCLAELGRRVQVLPWDHACFVVCEVLRGLAHVHTALDPRGVSLGIIHRDVNPSNVLVGEDGRVKLTDFGTVLMEGRAQNRTAPGMVKGKVRYLAPEYIAEQSCTHQVDVYGAGVMLFEMLIGRPSFAGGTNVDIMLRIVREGLAYESLEAQPLPAKLVDIVRQATARDPRRRFESATEMLSALEDFLSMNGLFTSPTRLAGHLRARSLFC